MMEPVVAAVLLQPEQMELAVLAQEPVEMAVLVRLQVFQARQ
jgi:hypothetical protein